MVLTVSRRFSIAVQCLTSFVVVSLLYLASVSTVRAEQGSVEQVSKEQSSTETDPQTSVPDLFVGLILKDRGPPALLLNQIDKHWHPGMIPMALEMMHFLRDSSTRERLKSILEKHTGEQLGDDLDVWYRWLWKQPENRHPHYAKFKSLLYENIDPVFAGYFDDQRTSTVRLDEIRWGGVQQDGIPPLRNPKMIVAGEADYLADTDVVFALKYGDDARAYPKRILAWHEMFVDNIDGVDYAGVYCTLCGAVIMYETVHDNVAHEMGTSGFLYRSNKVMYDRATQSLWNTTFGEPIVGPLVAKDIALQRSHIVTTTWGEWRRRHPDTTVLSLETGHRRNYDEGVAYQRYFATDELMFTVPDDDERLPNKAEILALQFPKKGEETVAIDAEFLSNNPVYEHDVGQQAVVVLTDKSGANRVYDRGDSSFVAFDGNDTITDAEGKTWRLDEAAIRSEEGQTLNRLPAHRAFWFGWVAVHPDTELVKSQ